MTRSMTIIEARRMLTRLPEHFQKHPRTGAVAVTRRGKPVLAVMPWELYESVTETMEILGDEEAMAAFRQGVREMEEGKGIPWEVAKKKLRL
jgi:PHD/YefM family antitoxin component YafN of YafNO toxin-antitoxin module